MKHLVLFCCIPLTAVAADPANPPSHVTNGVLESELPTLKITAQAEKRLGIELAKVSTKAVTETRLYAGEVMVSLMAGPDVLAPLPPGTIEEMRRLAEQQNIADGAVATAQVQLDAARINLQRTTQLAKERVGSERALDEARAAEALATTNLDTVKKQRALLGLSISEALKSPRRTLRVSVSTVELPSLDTAVPVAATLPGANDKLITAVPQAMPPSSNPLNGTADIFYALEGNPAPAIGQRLLVRIPVRDTSKEALIVPWSAIFHDANGDAWLYEQSAPQTFVRRRVLLKRVDATEAILDAGPRVGTEVVTVGAAELFGAEFGNGK